MKITVFGANGLTGRQLVQRALDAGHDVVAVTRHPADYPLTHGVIVRVGPTVVAVVGLTVLHHRIAEIDLILDPDKLAAVEISTG